MPEKQQQPQACVMVQETSQGNIAMRFRSGGIFALLQIYCLVSFERIFKISQMLPCKLLNLLYKFCYK